MTIYGSIQIALFNVFREAYERFYLITGIKYRVPSWIEILLQKCYLSHTLHLLRALSSIPVPATHENILGNFLIY